MSTARFSVVSVRLAAKVSHTTVNKVLYKYGPPDVTKTAKFY